MVKRLKYILIILFVWTISPLHLYAQKTDAFARVQISPREGLVRQPFKVSIHVHSSTWFTKPLEFQNLKIDNAFIIPFTRTVSGIDYINKKKYATLSFYYLVFPYKSGNLEIPELIINASIPPEGDYKGIPVTIKTKVQQIKVTEPSSKDTWMVAKNIYISETWNKPLDKLKVGDVIERDISIKAYGTLPSLILPLKIKKPNNTSLYPKQAKLSDKRTDEDVNGVRQESYSYLFEKEGEVIIPEEEIVWINPINKQTYKRKLPEHTLMIAANPDLALMESLKDSLMAMSPDANIKVEAEEQVIPWKKIVIAVILCFVLLLSLIKYGKKLYFYQKEIRLSYLKSEAYYFKLLLKSISNKSKTEIINGLYKWFDIARKEYDKASIIQYLSNKQTGFYTEFMNLKSENITDNDRRQIKLLVKELRKSLLNKDIVNTDTMSINP